MNSRDYEIVNFFNFNEIVEKFLNKRVNPFTTKLSEILYKINKDSPLFNKEKISSLEDWKKNGNGVYEIVISTDVIDTQTNFNIKRGNLYYFESRADNERMEYTNPFYDFVFNPEDFECYLYSPNSEYPANMQYKYYYFGDSEILLNAYINPKEDVINLDDGTDVYSIYVDDILEKFWTLTYSRYKNHYCFYENEDEISDKKLNDYMLKFYNLLIMTYDMYAPLIREFELNRDKLMSDIRATSKGKVRFNDTPQNGGDFSDDSHTSNITESENENATSGATPIERLDEIKRKISMLYKDWSDRFDILFIEEGNI